MKTPRSLFLVLTLLGAAALPAGGLLAQTRATTVPNNNPGTVPAQQGVVISQEAALWLANPASLFLQLDVDRDGILTANEFAAISVLTSSAAMLPGTVVVDPAAGAVVDPATGTTVPAAQMNPAYTPSTGVAPVTTPGGSFRPSPGVRPVTQPDGTFKPTAPGVNMRGANNPYAPAPGTAPIPQR